jgi:hypothetical protein
MESILHIVQLLLPRLDNEGYPFREAIMRQIREELVARFGGVTAFSRTPAKGVWSDQGRKVRDEVILVEVMVEMLDRAWWGNFREQLEARLKQKSLVIRALGTER